MPSASPVPPVWPLDVGADVRHELWTAYADPARGYHDTVHLTEVLTRLDVLATAGEEFDPVAVGLAAWFHDAVYDGERDAEERSAAWAEQELPALVGDDLTAEVARLVRLTELHRPEPDDANGCALSDADLGVLAAPAERYAAYVAAVREEYAHLDDPTFAAGRRAVLTDLLGKPTLFHTGYATREWEAPARANMTAELDAAH